MRLIFLLQKQAWFIEHEQAWFRLTDMTDVALAMSALALNMVNQHELIEQPHQAGTAAVTQVDNASLNVTLHDPDKQLLHATSIQLDEKILLNVDWITKQFRDGWMSADATVTLDNVGEMHLDAYLPARSGSDGKTLIISNVATGDCEKVWIARDKKTRVPLMMNGGKGKVSLSLQCEPEPIDKSTDPRQLGFVLISEQARPV